MPQRLYLIERPEDIPVSVPTAPSEAACAALTPAAALALERSGIPYRILEEFTPSEDFIRAGMERYAWLDSLATELDDRLQCSSPPARELGLRPAASHFHSLKVFVDGLGIRAQLLTNALRSLRPSQVLFRPSRPGSFSRGLTFEDESLYSHLLPEAARICGAVPQPIGEPADFRLPRAPRGIRAVLRPALWPSLPGKALGRLRALLRSRARPFWMCPPSAPLALGLYSSHDVPLLTAELARKGFAVREAAYGEDSLPGLRDSESGARAFEAEMRPATERLWRSLDEDGGWRKRFRFHGADVYPAARKRLEFFIRNAPPESALVCAAWTRRFQAHRPACLLSSSCNVGYLGGAILQAARRTGVPIILSQEGAGFGVPYSPLYDHTDMRGFDLFLCYGRGTRMHLEEHGIRPAGSVREAGSPRLDALRRTSSGSPPRSERFVYAPTYLHDRIQHAPFNGATAAFYYEWQKRLFRLFGEFPGIRFTVKQPPGNDRAPADWLALNANSLPNCRMTDAGSFEGLLGAASGFVLDFPSTTLLEALTTEKPLFILLEPYLTRLGAAAEKALARRAVLCRDLDGLRAALQRHLRGERLADWADDKARRLFCTHLDDGRSLDRACRAMEEATSQHAAR